MIDKKRMQGDVLVVGGGIAGCLAAIKAREKGANVILVDKGFVSKSGQSPYAGSFMVFNPDKGHKLDEWMSYLNKTSEYLNNRYWTEITITQSYARYKELVSWGLQFTESGKQPNAELIPPGLMEPQMFDPKSLSQILRNHIVKSGITVAFAIKVNRLSLSIDIPTAPTILPSCFNSSVIITLSTIVIPLFRIWFLRICERLFGSNI